LILEPAHARQDKRPIHTVRAHLHHSKRIAPHVRPQHCVKRRAHARERFTVLTSRGTDPFRPQCDALSRSWLARLLMVSTRTRLPAQTCLTTVARRAFGVARARCTPRTSQTHPSTSPHTASSAASPGGNATHGQPPGGTGTAKPGEARVQIASKRKHTRT